jgi:hypothetical protein
MAIVYPSAELSLLMEKAMKPKMPATTKNRIVATRRAMKLAPSVFSDSIFVLNYLAEAPPCKLAYNSDLEESL